MKRVSIFFIIISVSAALLHAQENGISTSAQQTKKFVWKRNAPAATKLNHAKKTYHTAVPVVKQKKLPPIIQAELERSQRESAREAQLKAAASAANTSRNEGIFVEQKTTIIYSLVALILLAAGLGIIKFKNRIIVSAKKMFVRFRISQLRIAKHAPAAVLPNAPSTTQRDRAFYISEPRYEETVHRSPLVEDYALYPNNEDEHIESPEAALTMSLLTRKRETRKKTIVNMVTSIRKKENPQHVAETLHVGMGEIQLAMNLAKFRGQQQQ